MSQQSEVQVEAIIVSPAVPQAIHTKWATVAVFGHELVSPRDLEVLGLCLNMPEWDEHDHGVRVVMFRDDDYPCADMYEGGQPIFAAADYDLGGIVINLRHHWRKAVSLALAEEERSIFACFNQHLLLSYLHEMCHLTPRVDANDRRQMERTPDSNEEQACEDFALEMLFSLAKTTDIEPKLWSDGPFFRQCMQDFMQDQGETGEDVDDWFKDQMWMLDNRIFYSLRHVEGENHPVTRQSFKGYVQLLDEAGGDGADWKVETLVEKTAKIDTTIADEVVAGFVAGLVVPKDAGGIPEDEAVQNLMDGDPVETVTVPNTGGAQMNAAGAPGTPFVMNGQQVGVNVAPDAEPVDDEEMYDYDLGAIYDGMAPQQSPPVAQQQAPAPVGDQQVMQTQAAPQQPVVQQPSMPQNVELFPIKGMDNARTQQIMKTVYMKVHDHIFNKCQPSFEHGFEKPFLFPEGALNLAIELTPEEQQVCISMNCHDTAGRPCMNIPTTKGLIGKLNTKKNLPMYELEFNYMGLRIKRRLVPQNPAKFKQDNPALGYSDAALRAQQGAQITWIFEADPVVKQSNTARRKAGDRTASDIANKIEAAGPGQPVSWMK